LSDPLLLGLVKDASLEMPPQNKTVLANWQPYQESLPTAVPVEDARPPKRRRRDSFSDDDEEYAEPRRELRVLGTAPLVGIFIGAIIVGLGSVCLGLFLSQYWPVFGGVLERGLAEPWSPARISLIPVHLLVFGLIGIVFGGFIGFLLGLACRT
jgi:hypothetical protein